MKVELSWIRLKELHLLSTVSSSVVWRCTLYAKCLYTYELVLSIFMDIYKQILCQNVIKILLVSNHSCVLLKGLSHVKLLFIGCQLIIIVYIGNIEIEKSNVISLKKELLANRN